MPIIYIPVEVTDEEVQRYAGQATLGATPVVQPGPTQQARVPSEFGYEVRQQPVPQDPWGTPAPVTTAAPPAVAPTPAPTPTAGAAPSTPLCDHGQPMKYVQAGISKSTNKPYNGFWACPLPRGQQCQKRV